MEPGRAIPGFYYDTEKQKYFKIQPNHRAPPGAKHSVENVRNEAKTLKKRRRDERLQAKQQIETIARPPLLQSSHSRLSLLREQGLQQTSASDRARSTALLSQLRHSEVMQLQSCGSCHCRHLIYDFVPVGTHGEMVLGVGDGKHGIIEHVQPQGCKHPLGGLSSRLTSVNVTHSRLVVVSGSTCSHGNVSLSRLPSTPSFDEDTLVSMILTMGKGTEEIVESKPSLSTTDEKAFVVARAIRPAGYTTATHLIDLNTGTLAGNFVLNKCVLSTTWLNPITVMNGCSDGSVYLWDVRSRGHSLRLTSGEPVRTLRDAGDGKSIWTLGNWGLSHFDLRMPDCKEAHTTQEHTGNQHANPRIGIRFNASTPALYVNLDSIGKTVPSKMEIWKELNTVAISTHENTIKLFSTGNGSLIRTLPAPPDHVSRSHWIDKIRFSEDERGCPLLLYNCGDRLWQWKYGSHGCTNYQGTPTIRQFET